MKKPQIDRFTTADLLPEAFSAASTDTGDLGQLIARLLASGDLADAQLAVRLEQQGWAGLTPAEVLSLLGRFGQQGPFAQGSQTSTDASREGQAPAAGQQGATTASEGQTPGQQPSGTPPAQDSAGQQQGAQEGAAQGQSAQQSQQPAADPGAPGSAGQRLLQAIVKGDVPTANLLPQASAPQTATEARPAQPIGDSILSALSRGDLPVVSSSAQAQASESGRTATPAPGISTPSGAAPAAAQASGVLPAAGGSSIASSGSTGLSSSAAASISPSSSVTSSMSRVDNLGISVDQANAGILTAFVEQRIGQAGSLASKVEIIGATTLQNTGVVGTATTGRAGSAAIEVPAAPPPKLEEVTEVPPPAPPPVLNGGVRIELSVGQASSVPEGGEGSDEPDQGVTYLVFTVTRTNGLVGDKIPYAITGIDQDDLAAGFLSGQVVEFAAGETVKELRIAIRRDRSIEMDERVTVTLSEGEFSDLIPGQSAAEVLVLNDDRFVSIARALDQPDTVVEGNGGSDSAVVTVVFRVTRTDSSVAERIPYTITGIDPADLAQGSLDGNEVEFAAGELTKEIRVVLRRDDTVEPDEFVSVSLQPTDRTGVTAGSESARVNVPNDDFFVSIARAPTQLEQTNEGSPEDVAAETFTEIVFVVNRTHGNKADSFAYEISGISGDDLHSGSLTGNFVEFDEGELSKEVRVRIRKDKEIENDELLTVTLSPSAHARIRDGEDTASVTIANDEGYLLSGLRAALIEGNDPEDGEADPKYTTVYVRLTRSAPSGADGSAFLADPNVPWKLVFGADGTAGNLSRGEIHPEDLDGVASFALGQATTFVPIRVLADNILEADEVFTFAVEPTNRLIVDPEDSITVIVANDDPTIEIVADSLVKSVYEGNTLNFEIRRASGLTYSSPIVLSYELVPMTRGETSLPAAGNRTGTLTFLPGDAEETLAITTVNDQFFNGDQRFYLLLSSSNPDVRISGAAAEGIVLSDDSLVSLTGIAPAAELDASGLRTYTVSISREGPEQFARSLSWSVTGIGENPSRASDFIFAAGENFKVNFPAGATTATVQFKAKPGLITDGERGFEVRLSDTNQDHLELGVDAIRGNIIPVGVSATLVPVTTGLVEGSDDGNPATIDARTHQFRVELSGPAPIGIQFNWTLTPYESNGVDAADFGGVLPTGVASIAQGQTTALISVTPTVDALVEPNERFYLNLSVASQSALFAGVAVPRLIGTISNDDATIGFASADQLLSADEGSPGGTGIWRVPVIREGFSRSEVSVGWKVVAVTDGTAESRASADDFSGGILPSGRLTLLPGELKADIEIPLAGEATLEQSERFQIVLEDGSVLGGALLGDHRSASGLITNDDTFLRIESIAPVAEGQGGLAANNEFIVTFVREGDLRQPARANYAIEATKNASNNADASDLIGGLAKGSVNFVAGQAEATLRIVIAADTIEEGNETFSVRLTGTPTARHLLSARAEDLVQLATINNDDDTVAFSSAAGNLAQTLSEDAAGTHGVRTMSYTLTRTGDTSKASSVYWALDLTGQTATADDFLDADSDPYSLGDTVGGIVTFAAGATTAQLLLKVNNDNRVEGHETFRIVLSDSDQNDNTIDPQTLGTRVAAVNGITTGTLLNDDVAIVATLTGGPLEGDTGTVDYTYTLSRVGDMSQSTAITWYVKGADIVDNGVLKARSLNNGDGITAATAEYSGPAGSTYGAAGWSGALTWAANDPLSTTKSVVISLKNDTQTEGPESFALTLTNQGGAHAAQFDYTEGVNLDHALSGSDRGLKGQVLDNDARVWVEAAAATVTEGAAGSQRTVTFHVYREGDLTSAFTVPILLGGNASGVSGGAATVSFDADTPIIYDSTAPLTDPPRQRVSVSYTLAGDNVVEVGEKIDVSLGALPANPTPSGRNVTVDAAVASTAVTNDDYRITAATNPAAFVNEGTPNANPLAPAGSVTYTFTRSPIVPTDLPALSIPWRAVGATMAGGVAVSPVNAADFAGNAMPTGTLSFALDATTASITLNFNADADIEPSEFVGVLLDTSIGNIEAELKTFELRADDTGFNVVARRVSIIEGDDPSVGAERYLEFDIVGVGQTATRTWELGAKVGNTTVDLNTVLAPGEPTTGSVTLSNDAQTIRLKLLQDSTVGEDVGVTLSLMNGSTLIASASTTVREDDAQLTIAAISGSTAAEGSDATPGTLADSYTELKFAVSRSGNLGQVTTVPWSVSFANGLNESDFFPSGWSGTDNGTGLLSSTYALVYANGAQSPATGMKGTLTFADSRPVLDQSNEDNLKIDLDADQIIRLFVKTDWIKEANEAVTVVLGAPSSGSSLAGGSQSATTTITNDDAEVQFTAGSLSLIQEEGDSGTTDFSFTLERTGNTAIASDVTWFVRPKRDGNGQDISAGINGADFSGNSIDDGGWAAGNVSWAANDTSNKTITVKINADTFERLLLPYWGYPVTQSTKLELDEYFTVGLANGKTTFVNPGVDTVQPSVSTSIGARDTAQGTILNDDVKIQITQIRSNLPEGTAPTSDGDVDPGTVGVQKAIQHSVTFERQGDASRPVWFTWSIDAGYTSQVFHSELIDGQAPASASQSLSQASPSVSTSDKISWAVGETGPKTLVFSPIGDDAIENDYVFTLRVTVASDSNDLVGGTQAGHVDEFSYQTGTGSIQNYFPNTGEIELVKFVVKRDEAGVWVSNDLVTRYDPETSSPDEPEQQYRGDDPYRPHEHYAGDWNWLGYDGDDEANAEGSMGVADGAATITAGIDYQNKTEVINFTESSRIKTFTVSIGDDAAFETREGVGLYLHSTNGLTIADEQGRLTIIDNDGVQGYWLTVNGSTAIEGVDDYARFTIDLGKPLSTRSGFDIEIGGEGSRALAFDDGEMGDWGQYFDYSTDGGTTWQSNAPVYEFAYRQGVVAASDDSLVAAYRFQNGSSYGNADNWLEFGDLRRDMGYQVGGAITEVDDDGHFEVWIPVRADAQFDPTALGLRFAGGMTSAANIQYEGVAQGSGASALNQSLIDEMIARDIIEPLELRVIVGGSGAAIVDDNGNGLIDTGEVTIAFDMNSPSQLGEDLLGLADRPVVIEFESRPAKALDLSGFGGDDRIEIDRAAFEALGYDVRNELGDNPRYKSDISGEVFGFYPVNGGVGTIPFAVVEGLQQQDKILMLAGAQSGTSKPVGLLGSFGTESSPPNQLNQYVSFVEGVSPNPVTIAQRLQQIQEYFLDQSGIDSDPNGVKFLKFSGTLSGEGAKPIWHLQGLDAADVVAPQNGDWSELMVVRELTVAAGAAQADASVALDTRALHGDRAGLSPAGTFQPAPLRAGFTITADSVDADGIRTIEATITRSANLAADAVHYRLSVDVADRAFQPGSAAREGIVSFDAGQTQVDLTFTFRAIPLPPPVLPPVYEQLVIVDQGPDGEVGAYIDQDGDGQLSHAEKSITNQAFADGLDLINLRENRVTIRFDALPDEPLNFQGFSADDRIELNLSALGRDGWYQGNTDDVEMNATARNDVWLGESNAYAELSGRTAGGEDFSIELNSDLAERQLRWSGRRRTTGSGAALPWGSGDAPATDRSDQAIADFGGNPLLDGQGRLLTQFVSMVRNDSMLVIVDTDGAYVDLDQDGQLDAQERSVDNRVFHSIGSGAALVHVGQDLLAHESITIRFDAVPTTPLVLNHLTSDDRILIGSAAESAWLSVRAAADLARQNSQQVDDWGDFAERASGFELPAGQSVGSLVTLISRMPGPATLHVVVDTVLDEAGERVTGAYRDLNRDGRIDAAEAVSSNLAFAANGTDLIGLAGRSVQITFRDAPQAKLDFIGFGHDDRVQVDLDAMADNGWVAGRLAHLSNAESSIGNRALTQDSEFSSGDVFAQTGRTALGQVAGLQFLQVMAQGDIDGPVRLDVQGLRLDGESHRQALAEFGKGRDALGLFGPQGRVEFLQSAQQVSIVVDGGHAYIDLDGDGVLDNAEATDDNLAFDHEGKDLVGLDRVNAVITFRDAPEVPLDFSGFGPDDRLEFDRLGLAASGWGGADVDISEWLSDARNTLSVAGQEGRSGFWVAGNGLNALLAGAWRSTTDSAAYTLARFGENYLAAFSAKPALQASLVRGEVARVIVDENGGWLDLDGNGVLSIDERADEHQVFDFDVAAGASNRVGLDLAGTKAVIVFQAVPQETVDLSGFGLDDRVVIDRSAFFARGWDLGLDLRDPIRATEQAAGLSAALLASEAGTLAVARVAQAGLDLLALASTPEGADESRIELIGAFGPDATTALPPGKLPGQVDFVQPTIYLVVNDAGAFFDLDADGLLSDAEFAWAIEEGHTPFDPSGRDARGLLDKATVVIEFNDAPATPIDLSGFGEDDRIRIDAQSFYAQGWAEGLRPTATSSFSFATQMQGSALLEQYASGEASRRAFGVGARFSRAASGESNSSTPAMAENLMFARSSVWGEAMIDNTVPLADFGDNTIIYEQYFALVDFVRSNLITGFLPGVDPISLAQRGSLTGERTDPDVLELEAGVSRVDIRAPLRDDRIDELLESITLTVSDRADGDAYVVPVGHGVTTLVDDDAPVLTQGEDTLYDGILQNHYAMVVFDVNNRDGDSPDVGNQHSPNDSSAPEADQIYRSSSLADNVGAGQSFTVKLRFLGNWEVALVGAVMPEGGQGYAQAGVLTNSDTEHNDGPPFRPILNPATETVDGVTYNVLDLQVPAGTRQILMRSLVGNYDDLSDEESAIQQSVSALITRVDPVVVVRDRWVDENAGTATLEAVAVGGTIGQAGATVTVATQEGHWEERHFIVSREYASFGSLTLGWAVEALGGTDQGTLVDGNGAGDYVSGYFGQIRVGTVDADDFVLVPGQMAGTGPKSLGLPTGTVTFADGQKEALITLRVRADNKGELDEDFRVTLSQPPAGVELLGNPDGPLTFKSFGAAGYGKIVNDDQVFTVRGLLLREDIASRVEGSPNDWDQSDHPGYAIPGKPQGLVAPTGYTLHQFIIHREGDNLAGATVDWVLQLKGTDTAGYEKVGNVDQAHKAETADFLAHASGNYNDSFGFTWGSAVDGVVTSAPKKVVFAPGQSQAVVTFAVADDALIEDAEIFRVQLLNPVALPGNDGNPGVSQTRSVADFLIADNDGSRVSVRIDWLDNSSDAGANAVQANLGNDVVSQAVYEGSSADWVTGTAGDYSNGDLANDRRMLLTFTRSNHDLSEASEAFFEVRVNQSNYGGPSSAAGQTGLIPDQGDLWSGYDDQGLAIWRGTVSFAAGQTQTTAPVTVRIPDDNLVDGNQQFVVTLYDHEHIPEAWTIGPYNQSGSLGDTVGIGAQGVLPDWNTTLRDAVLYTATATVVDDDVRLWLGGFRGPLWNSNNNYETVPSISIDEGTFAYPYPSGSDPAAPYGQAAQGAAGDLVLNFARAGLQQGDITLSWKILDSSGSVDYSDFNASYWRDSSGNATSTLADVAYVGGSFVLAGTSAGAQAESERTVSHTLNGLIRPDREVETDESFQIEFAVASVSAGPLSLSSVLFTPNYANEATQVSNSQHNSAQLAGNKTLLVNGTLVSDDVKYGIGLASTEADNRVTEGDSGTPVTLSFDVTRAISLATDTAGFNGGSSVGWRIVPVAGKPAPDANDFIDGLSGRVQFSGHSHLNGSWVRPANDSDIKVTLALRIRPDTKVEYGEHFAIELYDPSVGYVDPAAKSATGVIVNDDTGLIINDFRVIEGDSGEAALSLTVLRVGAMEEDSDFKWTLFNADTSNADFGDGLKAGDLTLTAADGTTGTTEDGFAVQYHTYTLTAEISGDTVVEADESFKLRLTKVEGFEELLLGSSTDAALGNASGNTANAPDQIDHTLAALNARTYGLSAETGAGQANVTLLNDDTIFSVQAARTEQIENGGAGYSFVVTRSVATPQAQTVTWSVVAEGGRNVVDAADFGGSLPSADITFSGSELSKTITVRAPSADGAPEADEVFTIKVTGFETGAEGDTFVTTGTGALGVIRNDDASVYISDSKPIIQTEGSGAQSRSYSFDIVRSGSGSVSASSVDWELVFGDGYGAVAADFTGPTSGTASFTADAVVTVDIAIAPDADVETLQDFGIRLKNAVGSVQIVNADGAGVGPIAKGQIGDDDFTLALASLQEGGTLEGDGRSGAGFAVNRTGALDLPVTLSWSLIFPQTGSAASASDFVASSGSLEMPGGLETFEFSLPVQGEVNWEEDEAYTLELVYRASDGQDVKLSAGSRILNDDEGFSVVLAGDAVDSKGVLEGSASVPGSMTLRFIREGDLSGESSVDWSLTPAVGANRVTTSGSASDFATGVLSGRVFFDGTETAAVGSNGQQYAYREVVIPLAGDNKYEADEGFVVTLSNQSAGSSIRQATLAGVIYNDDIGYRVALAEGAPASILEGNDGETTSTGGVSPGSVLFVLTREADPVTIGRSSRLGWALSSTGGDATALQAADVEVSGSGVSGSGLSGTVSFAPGETRKEVLVTMVGDDIREGTTRMTMTIARTGADTASTILAATASVQINDDDDTLAIAALPGAPLSEGNPVAGEEPGVYQFAVSRTGNPVGRTSVGWSLSQTGTHPVNASDLESILIDGVALPAGVLGGTLEFGDGVMSDKLIEVRVKLDRVGEEDERLTIELTDPSAGSRVTTASATQMVYNDDPLVRLVAESTQALEGNEGADGGFTFKLVRGGDSRGEVEVEWAIVPAGDAPVDLSDFGGVFPSGLVNFRANGSDEQFVRVLFQGDEVGEAEEGFRIELRTVTGADIVGPASVDMTIRNDDLAISVEAPTADEGDIGQSTSMAYRLSVRGPAIADRVTVKWHIEGFGINPASVDDFVEGQDLQGGSSLELFNGMPSGVSTIRLVNGLGLLTPTILVAGDDTYGDDESFRLVIDSIDAFTRDNKSIGATVVNDDLVAKTRDDDLLIGVATEDYEVVEGDLGVATIKFWIDVLGKSDLSPDLADLRVDWSMTGDLSNEDLVASSGQAVPLAYDSVADRWYVAVEVQGDEVIEPNERFTFRLNDAYDPATGGGVEIAEKGNTVAATIQGDDYGIQLANPSINQSEDRARFEFEILRDGPLDQTMDVRVRIGASPDSSAGISVNDFLPQQGFQLVDVEDDPDTDGIDESGTYLETIVSLAANETSARFSLEADHDPFPESDERFVVDAVVASVGGAAVLSPTWQERDQITATIVNDDSGLVPIVNPDPVLDPIQLPPT